MTTVHLRTLPLAALNCPHWTPAPRSPLTEHHTPICDTRLQLGNVPYVPAPRTRADISDLCCLRLQDDSARCHFSFFLSPFLPHFCPSFFPSFLPSFLPHLEKGDREGKREILIDCLSHTTNWGPQLGTCPDGGSVTRGTELMTFHFAGRHPAN